MNFSETNFIYLFLPIVVGTFLVLNFYFSGRLARIHLLISSFIFYAYWDINFLFLLILLLVVNRILHFLILRERTSRLSLFLLIAINLSWLGYFKYSFFLLDLISSEGVNENIFLPLAISFYTFQLIMYGIFVFRSKVVASGIDFALYILFFPQLIAGPLVKFDYFNRRFEEAGTFKFHSRKFNTGILLFSVGLVKKVLIANSLLAYHTLLYSEYSQGSEEYVFFLILIYSFYIYFDFSSYSDMARGIAQMLMLNLPRNFLSPYRARGIREFWRRWHVTLSRFLRDTLYIPLGGARKGHGRFCLAVIVTMTLGGLWHGAGINFVFWGASHGVFLILDRFFIGTAGVKFRCPAIAAIAYQFIVVSLLWVPFFSKSLSETFKIYSDLIRHLSSISGVISILNVGNLFLLALLVACGAAIWVLPRGEVFVRWLTLGAAPSLRKVAGLSALGGLLGVALVLVLIGEPHEFVYFQF